MKDERYCTSSLKLGTQSDVNLSFCLAFISGTLRQSIPQSFNWG